MVIMILMKINCVCIFIRDHGTIRGLSCVTDFRLCVVSMRGFGIVFGL